MPHKVIFFVESTNFGGTEQVVLNLLRSLDREQWEPVLFHHPEPGIATFLESVAALGIALEPIPQLNRGNRLKAIVYFYRRLRAHRGAIFHAQLTWTLGCRTALFIASFAGMQAIVATLHLFTEVPNPRTVLVQRALATRVDRYVCVAEHVARRMRETFHLAADQVDVVPNGIPVAAYQRPADPALRNQLQQGSARPVVLTVARLEDQHKGISWLLKAIPSVPQATFVIAGDGPDRAPLEKLAAQLGVQDRVSFLGFRRDIADLLSCCDIFVLPSLFEGLCLVILEAMAAGKPVVSTNIDGTNEVIVSGETGLLVPPANAVKLAAAIRDVLENSSLAASLAAAGNEHVRREFSSNVMAERVSAIYSQLYMSSPGAVTT